MPLSAKNQKKHIVTMQFCVWTEGNYIPPQHHKEANRIANNYKRKMEEDYDNQPIIISIVDADGPDKSSDIKE